jgi:MraZ protein
MSELAGTDRQTGPAYGFSGFYERSIDKQGRLSLPFPFRRYGDLAGDERFALTEGPQDILCLLPFPDFAARINELARQELDPAARDLLRTQLVQTQELRPDAQGRLQLPLELLAEHGIEGTVVVVGMNHYLELWPVAAFAAKRTAAVEKVRVEDLKRKLFA